MDFVERYADFVQKLGLFLGIDWGSLFSCPPFFGKIGIIITSSCIVYSDPPQVSRAMSFSVQV